MDDPPRQDQEPPLISLEEVRARRRAAQEQAAQSHAASVRRAWQDHTLTESLLAKRMTTADLWDMLRLGIVTDTEELLPCQDRSPGEDYFLWVRKAKDLMDPEEAQREAQPQFPDEPEWSIRERQKPRPRHTVECPLMASSIIFEESPPCIEALRRQATEEMWVKDRGYVTKPLDEEDPVVKYQVRPCALIGFRALVAVMKPVWERQQDQE